MKKIIILVFLLFNFSGFVIAQDSTVVYHPKRVVKLEGASNFRDLGGYPAANGKFVKWGKIYRSADISQLTDSDLQQMKSIGLATICDLRGPQETKSKPDKYTSEIRYVNLPAGSENVGTPASYAKMNRDSLMLSFYTKTDHLKAKYKPMFDELLGLSNEKSLLFHCTAGKDRTGMGAALILSALGVERSYIVADYTATNRFWDNKAMIEAMINSGTPESTVKSMMAADPKYINTFFEAVEKQFGSVDAFLKNEIGLDKKKLKMLRNKYLGSKV